MFNFDDNVFGTNGLTSYGGKFIEKARRAFTPAEIANVARTEVQSSMLEDKVTGKLNEVKSVCFFLTNGRQSFLTLSTRGKQPENGASVDLTKCEMVQIQREGEAPKLRIEVL